MGGFLWAVLLSSCVYSGLILTIGRNASEDLGPPGDEAHAGRGGQSAALEMLQFPCVIKQRSESRLLWGVLGYQVCP